jgi:DNA-binding NtrC family response regulator
LVLVVDDEPAIRLLCRVNLELEGYEVAEAATLAEARGVLATRGAALVLLDMHIGNERGNTLLDELAEHHPPIPVAVVTGSTELDAGERMRADAVLGKPFTIDALLETVRSLAAHGSARR